MGASHKNICVLKMADSKAKYNKQHNYSHETVLSWDYNEIMNKKCPVKG